MLTQEYIPGVGYVTQQADFERYANPYESAAGYLQFLQNPRYKEVLAAPDLMTAITAMGRSGYATDPAYGSKLSRLTPRTPEQQSWFQGRMDDLSRAGAPPVLAELGARQSALETGWGRSAPGNNYFGIKAQGQPPMQLAQAGRPDIQQGLYAEIPPMGAQQPQQQAPGMAMPPQPQQQPPGFMDKLNMAMQNPLFLTGASILANNTGNYGAAAPAIGRGLMGGQAMAGAMQEDALNAQMKRMQMQDAQRKMAQEEQAATRVEEYLGSLSKEDQMLARMSPDSFVKAQIAKQYGGATAQYGVQPHYERDAEGNVYEVRYASDGTKKVTKLDRTPFAVESRSPEFIGQQAESRAQGTARGTAAAETLNKYSDDIAQMQNTQQTIEELARLSGRTAATGFGSRFWTWPGGDAADYEEKFSQLKGQNFLAMIPNMKGMGALSNAEGDALKAAASDLALRQSDEQHATSLAKLYAILNKGMERIRTRKLLGPGQEVNPPSQAEIDAIRVRLFGGAAAPSAEGSWKIERLDTGGGS